MRVFISYRTNAEPDRSICDHLSQEFGAKGHQIFVDRHIPVGVRWAEAIERGIEEADFLVLLLSEESSQSEMVLSEVVKARQVAALRNGFPKILPVRLAYRGQLPYPLGGYVDCLQHLFWSGDSDTAVVAEQLLRAMEGQGEPTPSQRWASEPAAECPGAGRPSAYAQLQAYVGNQASSGGHPRLPTPGGALEADDPFYVERQCDKEALGVIHGGPGQTITIKGPRQVGKSSLLMRVLSAALGAGRQAVLVDFQLLAGATGDEGELFKGFLQEILTQLELPALGQSDWDPDTTPAQCCTRLLERLVLTPLAGPLTLACDEADLILALPFRDNFFGMLRAWHGKRANPMLRKRWGKLDLVLVTSTEPYLFIDRADQSPFNVGAILSLEDFTLEQMGRLNVAHGTPLSERELAELLELTGGHPYLVRRALYAVSSRGQAVAWQEMKRSAAEDTGPFGDHLRRHVLNVLRAPELRPVLVAVLAGQSVKDEVAVHRLVGAGLVRRRGAQVVPRCAVYADYLGGKV